MRMNTDVYKEMQRTLQEDRPERRTTVAIIPIIDDDDYLKRACEFVSETSESRGNTAIRFRTLFDCVLVLIGDFDWQRGGPHRDGAE